MIEEVGVYKIIGSDRFVAAHKIKLSADEFTFEDDVLAKKSLKENFQINSLDSLEIMQILPNIESNKND